MKRSSQWLGRPHRFYASTSTRTTPVVWYPRYRLVLVDWIAWSTGRPIACCSTVVIDLLATTLEVFHSPPRTMTLLSSYHQHGLLTTTYDDNSHHHFEPALLTTMYDDNSSFSSIFFSTSVTSSMNRPKLFCGLSCCVMTRSPFGKIEELQLPILLCRFL